MPSFTPLPPQRSPDDSQPTTGHRLIGWMLTIVIGLTLVGALAALLVRLFGAGPIAVLIAVAVLFGIPLFHYLVWGWWLSRWIKDDEPEE